MSLQKHIAKQFRDIYFGGNWTASNLKNQLADVTWQQATTKVNSFNTILQLVFHIDYYVAGVTKVLQGGTLDISDIYAFDAPSIQSQNEWENFLNQVWENAKNFALLIEQLPEDKLWEIFHAEQYGNYYRNIHGIIEHNHYHLGQIVLIKKLLLQNESS